MTQLLTPVGTPSPSKTIPSLFFGSPLDRISLSPEEQIPAKKFTTAFDYRIKYQKLQSKANQEGVESVLDIATLFPREGVYGGMPLLIWNKMRVQKFIIIAGEGREYEGKMVMDAKKGLYENTKTVDCRASLKDPPEGSMENNGLILKSLADEIHSYWIDKDVENIVIYCFAGQNRSMASTLLFLMLYVYNRLPNEMNETFARRILTLLSGSRPSAYMSIPDVKWIGENKKGYQFSWFELVMDVYGKEKGKEEKDLMIF